MRVVKYKLFPAQRKFLFGFSKEKLKRKSENGNPIIHTDIALYQGGFGSGKTFCGSLRGIYFALNWPGSKGLVTAKTQDLLDETTKAKYIDHLDNIGMKEGIHWWFENRKTVMNFINGSSIYFKTASDWQSFRSREFAWIELEEASFLEEKLFLELLGRLRQMKHEDWKNYYHAIFLHTNPQGKRGWIYKRFINPKTRGKDYRYVIASTRENTYLGEEYVRIMEEAYSAEQAAELIDGLDLDYDNTIAFPQFTEDNLKENLKFNPNYPVILTCDFNYNPMCWYLMQEIDGAWYIIKELINQSVTTAEMCQLVQPIIDEVGIRDLIIMGDAHGRDKKTNGTDYSVIVAHFGALGYNITQRVQKSNPLIKERLAVLRGLLRNAKGTVRIFIDRTCEKLIYNFEECRNQLANGGLRLPTDSEIQADPPKLFLIHPIDAISYPMWYLHSLRAIAGNREEL